MKTINLNVHDLNRSLQFYRDELGLTLSDQDTLRATLDLDESHQLNLFTRGARQSAVSARGICLSLDPARLTSILSNPKLTRLDFMTIRPQQPCRMPVKVLDPDGYQWCVCVPNQQSSP